MANETKILSWNGLQAYDAQIKQYSEKAAEGFIVTVTLDETRIPSGADKTFAEIVEAHEAGKNVQAFCNNCMFQLAYYSSVIVSFSVTMRYTQDVAFLVLLSVLPTDTWSYTENEITTTVEQAITEGTEIATINDTAIYTHPETVDTDVESLFDDTEVVDWSYTLLTNATSEEVTEMFEGNDLADVETWLTFATSDEVRALF